MSVHQRLEPLTALSRLKALTRMRSLCVSRLPPLLLLLLLVVAVAPVGVRATAAPPSSSPPPTDLISVDEVKYVVGLQRARDTDEAQPRDDPGASVVEMVSAQGRRFRCSIPPLSSPSLLRPSAAASAAVASPPPPSQGQQMVASVMAAQPSSASASSPPAALGAVAGTFRRAFRVGCFARVVEWWTYEVCPFRAIRQFHHDGSAPAGPHGTYLSYQLSTVFSLGEYVDEDAWQLSNGEWLYTQRYTGGSDGRQATVRFICPQSPQAPPPPPPPAVPAGQQPPQPPTPHTLAAMQERPVHHYTFDVVTPLACPEVLSRKPKSAPRASAAHAAQPPAAASPPSPSSSLAVPSFPDATADMALLLELLHPLQSECMHNVSHQAHPQPRRAVSGRQRIVAELTAVLYCCPLCVRFADVRMRCDLCDSSLSIGRIASVTWTG